MSENSKIEWTDHTFNPWIGCTKVSPGCANCYAETQDQFRKWTPEGWGQGKPRKRTSTKNWNEPLKWNRSRVCAMCGYRQDIPNGPNSQEQTRCGQCRSVGRFFVVRQRVFCASLADWLDDEVPIEWLADLLKLIHDTPNLDWLLLTKRPENFFRRVSDTLYRDDCVKQFAGAWVLGKAPANVWIGTTVEDQTRAEERIPKLIGIPARVHFLSCEPLLGPLNIAKFIGDKDSGPTDIVDWVICGGESGPEARPMHPEWARSLRDQCATANVPYFFKQWGEWIDGDQAPCGKTFLATALTLDGVRRSVFGDKPKGTIELARVGKKTAGRLLDGVEHNASPL